MHCTSLSKADINTAQAATFELKQLGFTAAYRAR
jgi:hypothetical protein